MPFSSPPNGKFARLHREKSSFTLVELLVSMALLSLVSLMLVSVTNSTAATWRYTAGKIEQFRGAGPAFEAITRRVSQATLNTYWDYDSPTAPTKYMRQSELRFISGATEIMLGSTSPHRPTHGIFFQAPLGFVDDPADFSGLDNLLNTWGYYVEFNKDTRPAFINALPNAPPSHYRYRLMELMQPSNELTIYSYTSGVGKYQAGLPNCSQYVSLPTPPSGYTGLEWFTVPMLAASPPVHVLAENVIALVILPKLSPEDEQNALASGTSGLLPPLGTNLAPNYSYDSTATNTIALLDSKNQLPPLVQVTMVAIDEASALRVSSGSTVPAFDTLLGTGQTGTPFTTAANLTTDLTALQNGLIAQHISYRVFTSTVSVRGAKWSTK